MENANEIKPKENKAELRALLLGGILPLVVYTVVEEMYGIVAGLICGMVLGILEITFEKIKHGKVETITWIGNGLLLGLGSISLLTQEGVWFRLQPAILEAGMAAALIISVITQKPFLLLLARKQKTIERMPPVMQPIFEKFLSGFTLRIAIFFLLHAGLAAYAALYWSTRAWMLLKGVGFTGSFIVYGLIEVLFFRCNARRILTRPPSHTP